jgi:hypothetical protein
MSTNYAQAVGAVGHSIARAKHAGGAEHYSLSTVRVQDLRRFVLAVLDERPALTRPEPPTKTRMAEWLVEHLRCSGCSGTIHQHVEPCHATYPSTNHQS